MPIVVQKEWWVEGEIESNPDQIYVFGDNETRLGVGGQAKYCRGQPNTIGIRTKADKFTNKNSYWTDETLARNCRLVLRDFDQVLLALEQGKTLVFPADGFGTGRAKLAENAPKTLRFIKEMTIALLDAYEVPPFD